MEDYRDLFVDDQDFKHPDVDDHTLGMGVSGAGAGMSMGGLSDPESSVYTTSESELDIASNEVCTHPFLFLVY